METKVVPAKTFFYHEGKTTLKQIHPYANEVVPKLLQELETQGLEATGPMEFLYFGASGDMDQEFTLQIALPVKEEKPSSSDYRFKQAPEFKCLSGEHQGDVLQMYPAYDKLFNHLHAQKLTPGNEIREVYVQWEEATSPNNLTEIQIGLN